MGTYGDLMKLNTPVANQVPEQPPAAQTLPEPNTSVRNSERFSERIPDPPPVRTEHRPEKSILFPRKRRSSRYSFEFYDDQIFKLKELKHQAEMSGEKVTLSDFAREAFDQYLKRKGL